MNILFLTTHLNAGGITSYLYLLTQGLQRLGHKVFLVSGGGELSGKFERIGTQLKTMNIRTKSELDPRIYLSLIPLRTFVEKNAIDIIHAHTRVTQVMGDLLSRCTKRTYVSTCHGYFKTRWVRRLFPCWGKAVIAISKAVAQHLEEDLFVPRDRIYLIHNGIDVKRFPFVDQNLRLQKREAWQLGQDPIVGIIARLSDVKGHDILLRAMVNVIVKFPKAKLIIVGHGKEQSKLRALTQTLHLHEQVIFLSQTNNSFEMLSLFDVFVLPSYKEGLALSIVEAQATGLPVIASRVGGIPELIEDRKTGLLVDAGDSQALGEAIVFLLSHREQAQRIGRQAHDFVIKNFTAERMVEMTIQIYKKSLRTNEKNFGRQC